MRMNRIEKFLMNNPMRAAIQRRREAPLLERLGGRVEGLRVLEIGCGRGVGTRIIFERFGAASVQAVDLDPDMIRRARRRLAEFPPERLTLSVGDVTALEFADASFDAVFDFAIIHHVPNWRSAVAEVRRVLRPGGRFFFEEVTRHALDKAFYRLLMKHPEERCWFGAGEFVAELEARGLEVGGNFAERGGGDFVFGVGRRKPTVTHTRKGARADVAVCVADRA